MSRNRRAVRCYTARLSMPCSSARGFYLAPKSSIQSLRLDLHSARSSWSSFVSEFCVVCTAEAKVGGAVEEEGESRGGPFAQLTSRGSAGHCSSLWFLLGWLRSFGGREAWFSHGQWSGDFRREYSALQAAVETPSWSGYESGPCSATSVWVETVIWTSYLKWDLLLVSHPEMTTGVWGDVLDPVVAVHVEVLCGDCPCSREAGTRAGQPVSMVG
ncbi:hypothetical protein HPB50_022759 [Hyalomma asiaticum]|uniref:Uncharacterized protein n=1 Tax=Hyalomma asiaticum TaxID=266040 RepID=A0ACB7SAS7_HYAAI|nr:hypothetical protein HPB50_022759 [Hyalomma asiaticum]